MRIDHVTTSEGLAALETEWNDLLARSPTDSVFLRHEWVSTWWEVFGDAFRLHLLVARAADGALIGIAPLVVGRGPGRLMGRLPHLMLVGQQGETLAEHLDLIVSADAVGEVVPALVAAARRIEDRWDVLLFERVPEDSPTLAEVERVLRAQGLEPVRTEVHASPYLTLPASFDDLLKARSKNFRRQWNNSRNRLQREGDVRLHVAGDDLPVEEAFDHLVRLHRARWGDHDGSFASERYLRFHRRLSRVLCEKKALFLGLLDVGGRYVAARYDFLHAQKVWCFQGGRLPEYEKMRPGTVLTGMALAWALERGYREYDFLSGGEGYKDRWADGERRLVDLRVLTDRPRVRWTLRLQRLKDRLRPKR